MALAFDLYILGEDYSVKRFGAFLGANSPEALERQWEKWVSRHRDPFAPLAMPVLTTLLLLGAAAVIWIKAFPGEWIFWTWLILAGLPTWLLFAFYLLLRGRTLKRAQAAAVGHPLPSTPLERLRTAVEDADYLLTRATYDQAKGLFIACSSNPEYFENLLELAPEYGRAEFLLCVDSKGAPAHPAKDIVEDFRETVSQHPNFAQWFHEAATEEGHEPVLLVARWLCHLAGFRHRSVHLFIDHPTLDDYTLIQIRSAGKFEAPGRFDVPAAGHVVGLDSVTDTLYKELEGELGWGQGALDDLKKVGGYEYCEPPSNVGLRNVEYRVVYRCRIKANRLREMRFADREVAAVSIFALSELQALIRVFPDRVASGLAASFPVYLKDESE